MFSEAKARRVTQFIECLKHTKGEFHGEPFKLLPWQEKIIRDVFGTVRDDDPSMRQNGCQPQDSDSLISWLPSFHRRSPISVIVCLRKQEFCRNLTYQVVPSS